MLNNNKKQTTICGAFKCLLSLINTKTARKELLYDRNWK